MKTITYNPETHVLVPREPSEEMIKAGKANSRVNQATARINWRKQMKLNLPELAEGETYVGCIGDALGNLHHIILLPGEIEGANWKKSMEWAKSIGGDLPNRIEQAMLWANHRDQFQKDLYWSNETHHSESGWAWYQSFACGYQHGLRHGHEFRARAVRRVPINQMTDEELIELAAIAAAPQPLPNPNWCAGCSPDNCSGCGAEPVAYTTPQPDRVAELIAELEHIREQKNRLWFEFSIATQQLAALNAELREICAAIDDPACDLTLTTVECIKKLKGENESLKLDAERKTNGNRKIRDLVDGLLAQAGYASDSSARHNLSLMNFDAAMTQGEKG